MILSIFFLVPQLSFSQENTTRSSDYISLRRGLATVVFFGLGGAVVGLSTLSFYGRPQDNLQNISYGLGLGLVIGSVYVVSQSNNQQKDSMALDPIKEIRLRHPQPYANLFQCQFSF